MAKKTKCLPDEIPTAIKVAKNAVEIIPDVEKATVALMKRVKLKTINEPKGCVPKPKGGGGAKTKEYFDHYRAIEKKTGVKWKDVKTE